ncbi:MAG: hypothetical protein ACYS8Z_20170 [Planctomycetota bacterium]|jgi:hypothetical protein
MVELEKPSTKNATLTTVAALLNLFGSFMMTASRPEVWVLTLFLCAEICLIAGAIRAWGRYFKEYVGFEIERRLKETGS